MHGLYATAGFVLAAILLYRFHRPILAALSRFDARNTQRKISEVRDRQDRHAHYKHTLDLVEEQVDIVREVTETDARTGSPVQRFSFAGEMFSNREDAEAARQADILAKAREFYVELPAALTRRGKETLR